MYDVRNVEIQIGQKVKYTSHDNGTFTDGVVLGFTSTKVRIMNYFGGRPGWETKKDPKFIVVM